LIKALVPFDSNITLHSTVASELCHFGVKHLSRYCSFQLRAGFWCSLLGENY